MAAPSPDLLCPGPSTLCDIYHDGPMAARSLPSGLPCGGCNFADLSRGANGVKCGCRRFWASQAPLDLVSDRSSWCMCSHHACYHDEAGSHGLGGQPAVMSHVGQENERPPTGREPLSPVVDVPVMAPALAGADLPSFGPDPSLSFIRDQSGHSLHRFASIQNSTLGTPLPDTMNWCEYAHQEPGVAVASPRVLLPPIPSQCLMQSESASTTSSMQAKYLKPFSGKGLHTFNSLRATKQHAPLKGNIVPTNAEPHTPQREQDALEESFVFISPEARGSGTPRSGTATQAEPRAVVASATAQGARPGAVTKENFRNLSDTVSGHEQRLDRLETVSLSSTHHEECNEKYDQLDLRTTELENRMEEIEKQVHDNDSVAASSAGNPEDAAARSIASVSTSYSGRQGHQQDLLSHIRDLQAQVHQLQSSLPSYGHPWELEVVFLPFPLQKIWQAAHQFKSDPGASPDDWTQLPMTHSAAAMRSQSPLVGDWGMTGHAANWLLPRACSDQSILDKRLRSRGLVKPVSVRGSDARTVQLAILSAFENVFREMGMMERPACPDPSLSGFLGLQSLWVPLRKIHKDSRLRFLSPAEMATPAMWNVQFLHSVMMRSSEPRLFITHPDAYLQDLEAYEAGWNWQRLRELSRVYDGVTISQETPEADALEACWAWNESLDEALGLRTSASLRRGGRDTSGSPHRSWVPSRASRRSLTPAVAHGQSSTLSGRRRMRPPPRIRTASMPPTGTATRSIPPGAGRRVASYRQSRRPSPFVITGFAAGQGRMTRSPSHSRFTPRWTASPSPMPLSTRPRQAARGTTPVAYPTPHSNAPLQEMRVRRGSSMVQDECAEMLYENAADLDELYNIEIYESTSDQQSMPEDDDDAGADSVDEEMVTNAQPNPYQQALQLLPQRPMDEPWPGIEDQDVLSNEENVEPGREDQRSNVSSQPSEYPSTQRAWPEHDAGFEIHEDDV